MPSANMIIVKILEADNFFLTKIDKKKERLCIGMIIILLGSLPENAVINPLYRK